MDRLRPRAAPPVSFGVGEHTDAVIILAIITLSTALGFEPLPPGFMVALAGMVATYLLLVETAKWWFYRRWTL